MLDICIHMVWVMCSELKNAILFNGNGNDQPTVGPHVVVRVPDNVGACY